MPPRKRSGLKHVSGVLDDYFARRCRHCGAVAVAGLRCCDGCWRRVITGELVANTGICVLAGTVGEQLRLDWGQAA